MFITFDQIYVATFIFALGFIFAIILGIFDFSIRNNALIIVKNVLVFLLYLLMAFFYCFLSVKLNFPTFRVYMPIAFFFGLYFERKTLHLPLAKLYKKLYNRYIVKKVKNDGR